MYRGGAVGALPVAVEGGTWVGETVGANAPVTPVEAMAGPMLAEPQARTRQRRVAGLLVAADLAAVSAAFAATGVLQHAGVVDPDRVSPAAPALAASAVLWLVVFALYGLYDRSRLAAASEEARRVFHGVTVCVVGMITASFALGVDASRGWVATLWLAALVSVGVFRLLVRRIVRFLHTRGLLTVETLVVGTNEEARMIARTLGRQRWAGYRPAGFVSVTDTFATVDGLPVVGSLEDLSAAILRSQAGAVIVAGTAIGSGALPDLCRELQAHDVEIRISAGLPEIAASRVAVEPLDGLAVLAVRRNQLSRMQATTKRAFDVVGATLLLLVCAPVMAAVALAVRVTSGAEVLFRQVRVGEGGRPFTLIKFRTMVPEAEQQLRDLVDSNEADGLLFKLRNDPRVTPLGRVLRRWGLDELPQLWNVVRGEMSLVGPRPPMPDEAARYDEWIAGRLKVKPGLTGLWQVNGRHELSFDDYVRYDLFYVENWSMGLDMYVVAKTLPALLARRGAY